MVLLPLVVVGLTLKTLKPTSLEAESNRGSQIGRKNELERVQVN